MLFRVVPFYIYIRGISLLDTATMHYQAHDEWFEDRHKYLPWDEYRSNPEKYDDPKCPSHGLYLIVACEKCECECGV